MPAKGLYLGPKCIFLDWNALQRIGKCFIDSIQKA